MRQIHIYLLVFLSVLGFLACKKKNSTPAESKLEIAKDYATGVFSVASSYPVRIQLKSKMPADGIKIEILANQEASGAAVTPQTPAFTTKDTVVNTTVISLPRQLWVVTKVRVSSVTTPTNKDSATFRVIFK